MVDRQILKSGLKRSVVLVGMMGSGKTAIGRALADRLGVAFLDSDQAIEDAAQMTVSEVFSRDGEAFFRARETEVLARLLDGAPAVLSTGGGAFLRKENRDLIETGGVSVLLEADLDLLWERVRHKSTRPLLQTDDPRATLAKIFAQRAPIYAQAKLKVTADPGFSIPQMTDAVVRALEQAGIVEMEATG